MLNHASDFARASTLDIQKPPNLTNALHSYLHNTCSESIWESHNSHRQVEPHGPRLAQCAALLKSCQSQCRLSPKDHPCTLDFRDFPPRWSQCAESAQVLLSCLRIPPTRSAGSSLRIADANAFKEARLGNGKNVFFLHSWLEISFGGIPNSRNVFFDKYVWSVLPSQALETHQPAPKPPRPSLEPSPEPCWTWPASAQSLPEPSPEPPSPELCWTWPASAPNPPRPSPEPSPKRLSTKASQAFSGTFYGTCWTWLGFAPRLPGTFSGTFSRTLLNLTWLCTKASQTFAGTLSGTFSGTFSRTLLNLTWLCPKASREPSPGTFSASLLNLTWLCIKASQLLRNLLQNPVEPDLSLTPSPEPSEPSPEPRWTWPAPVHTAAILGWRPH